MAVRPAALRTSARTADGRTAGRLRGASHRCAAATPRAGPARPGDWQGTPAPNFFPALDLKVGVGCSVTCAAVAPR
jgi:hypothetical protein